MVQRTGRKAKKRLTMRFSGPLHSTRFLRQMQSRLELLDEINKAEAQIAQGQGVSHEEASKLVMERIEP